MGGCLNDAIRDMFDISLSLGDALLLFRVNIKTDDFITDLGIANRKWKADIAKADDADDGGFVV